MVDRRLHSGLGASACRVLVPGGSLHAGHGQAGAASGRRAGARPHA